MERSKEVSINLEELLKGIFSILMLSDKKLEVTYDQLFEYESQVVNYFQDRNYEIIINNNQEEQRKIAETYPEIKFDDEKISLCEGTNFLNLLKTEYISEFKTPALMSDKTLESLIPNQFTKKITLS